MADKSFIESITILRGHLEEIQEALDAARGFHVADDLARQYRNIGGTARPSNLSRKLEKALTRVEGYLQQEEHEDEQ